MDVIAGSPADKAVLHGDNRITNIDKEENQNQLRYNIRNDNKTVITIDDILIYLQTKQQMIMCV